MAISTRTENFQVLRLNTHFRMENACHSLKSLSNGIAQQFQNGGRRQSMERFEPWKYVSISFYFSSI